MATNAFNPDGIPVAIEGLRRLSVYLNAIIPTDDHDLKGFAQHLNALADLNEMFEQSPHELADFDRWWPQARILLEKLERATESRLSGGAATSKGSGDPEETIV